MTAGGARLGASAKPGIRGADSAQPAASAEAPAFRRSRLRACGKQPLSYRLTLVVLAGGMEAQPPVEVLWAVGTCVVAHCQPVMRAPHGFLAQLFDGESAVALQRCSRST